MPFFPLSPLRHSISFISLFINFLEMSAYNSMLTIEMSVFSTKMLDSNAYVTMFWTISPQHVCCDWRTPKQRLIQSTMYGPEFNIYSLQMLWAGPWWSVFLRSFSGGTWIQSTERLEDIVAQKKTHRESAINRSHETGVTMSKTWRKAWSQLKAEIEVEKKNHRKKLSWELNHH